MTHGDLVVLALAAGVNVLVVRGEAEHLALLDAQEMGERRHLALSFASQRVCTAVHGQRDGSRVSVGGGRWEEGQLARYERVERDRRDGRFEG